MSKEVEKKPTKTGRPKLDIDESLVENLASIGCTLSEIAAACNCSEATLKTRFQLIINKGRENGKTRLRKKQIELALGGNVTLLIWLGKQMLNQSEKVEAKTEHSGEIGGTLDADSKRAVNEWARTIQAKIKKSRTKR